MKFFGAHHEVTGEVDMEKVYVKNTKEVNKNHKYFPFNFPDA